MDRILSVTGGAGGVGVGNLQHRSAGIVLNTSLMGSATMIQPSDDFHNVFLADRSEVVPEKNNITVQGIMEKSWLGGAAESRGLATTSSRSHCHSSQAQPYQGRSREPQSLGTFSHWNLDLISLLVRMNGGTLF
jgi:hypothetical protein